MSAVPTSTSTSTSTATPTPTPTSTVSDLPLPSGERAGVRGAVGSTGRAQTRGRRRPGRHGRGPARFGPVLAPPTVPRASARGRVLPEARPRNAARGARCARPRALDGLGRARGPVGAPRRARAPVAALRGPCALRPTAALGAAPSESRPPREPFARVASCPERTVRTSEPISLRTHEVGAAPNTRHRSPAPRPQPQPQPALAVPDTRHRTPESYPTGGAPRPKAPLDGARSDGPRTAQAPTFGPHATRCQPVIRPARPTPPFGWLRVAAGASGRSRRPDPAPRPPGATTAARGAAGPLGADRSAGTQRRCGELSEDPAAPQGHTAPIDQLGLRDTAALRWPQRGPSRAACPHGAHPETNRPRPPRARRPGPEDCGPLRALTSWAPWPGPGP